MIEPADFNRAQARSEKALHLETIVRRDFKDQERSVMQENIARAVEADPEKFMERFKKLPQSLEGRFISADTFKETFEQYRESNATRNALNAPAHNAAAVLASEQFRRVLAEPTEPGRDRVVLLTGIPGAGKTSSVLENGILPRHTHAVYEGQLANPEVALAKVKQVLDAGLTPVIMVAHTTPEQALENTLKRFSEIGRGASIGVMATIQGGLPAGLSAVRELYGDAVELRVMDRRNFTNQKALSGWDNLPILESEGNHERIKQRLTQHLEQQRGHLSESAYRQAAGLAPIADRRIDGGFAQQHETSVLRSGTTPGNQQAAGLVQPSTDHSTPSSQQMDVSRQKIDAFAASHGLKVGDAEVLRRSYQGEIIAKTDHHVLLKIGPAAAVRYEQRNLDREVNVGNQVIVQHGEKSQVRDQPVKEIQRDLGM